MARARKKELYMFQYIYIFFVFNFNFVLCDPKLLPSTGFLAASELNNIVASPAETTIARQEAPNTQGREFSFHTSFKACCNDFPMSGHLWSTQREEREICMLLFCIWTGILGD